MEPNFMAARSVLGNVYVQLGLFEKALAEFQKVQELTKGVAVVETSIKALIGYCYARWGKRSRAMKILDELTTAIDETDQSTVAGNVSPHSIAEIHAALDQKEKAFQWLNKALDRHDMQMVSLKVNPTLDVLRADPRFGELVRRVGLPQ
jgi:tetratricopeptide (TPR) repeat protein